MSDEEFDWKLKLEKLQFETQKLIEASVERFKFEPQSEIYANGWTELRALFKEYAHCFLDCKMCQNRPHCHCGGKNGCDQECPDPAPVEGVSQLSHCPTCLHIAKEGASYHPKLSNVIKVFCCANCKEFNRYWTELKQDNALEKLKCDFAYGRCLLR